MKFPEREEILEQRQIRNHMYNRYLTRFVGTTAIAIVLFLSHVFSSGKTTEIPTPSPEDYEIAHTLTTIEGRETILDEKYDNAKIIKESTYGKDIISVFEVDYMYSFCVFEAIEDGYWMEYCGKPFPKTELVKGTVSLGDNTSEYDVYLQGNTPYTYLLIDRVNMTQPHNVQQQKIHFDKNGIALMKLDPEIYDPTPRIVAYDANDNYDILADGTL
ncbi:MAG: hypothetical protein IKY28_04815 [Anaerotignum sp.]|nr:hypothetical protein [Anaerotignum sp.]